MATASIRLRSGDLGWRAIDGEVIAVDFAGSRYIATNPAGTLLWEALASGTDVDALVDALVSRFGIPPARARDDVAGFLRSLEERALLERVPAGA